MLTSPTRNPSTCHLPTLRWGRTRKPAYCVRPAGWEGRDGLAIRLSAPASAPALPSDFIPASTRPYPLSRQKQSLDCRALAIGFERGEPLARSDDEHPSSKSGPYTALCARLERKKSRQSKSSLMLDREHGRTSVASLVLGSSCLPHPDRPAAFLDRGWGGSWSWSRSWSRLDIPIMNGTGPEQLIQH